MRIVFFAIDYGIAWLQYGGKLRLKVPMNMTRLCATLIRLINLRCNDISQGHEIYIGTSGWVYKEWAMIFITV